jgi:hypothetical protein
MYKEIKKSPTQSRGFESKRRIKWRLIYLTSLCIL